MSCLPQMSCWPVRQSVLVSSAFALLHAGTREVRVPCLCCTCSTGALSTCKTSRCASRPPWAGPLCTIVQDVQQQQVNGAALAQDFTGVTRLLAAGNRIRQVEGLHALTNLLHLDLGYNQLSAADGLQSLPRLEVLVSVAQTVLF